MLTSAGASTRIRPAVRIAAAVRTLVTMSATTTGAVTPVAAMMVTTVAAALTRIVVVAVLTTVVAAPMQNAVRTIAAVRPKTGLALTTTADPSSAPFPFGKGSR